MQASGSVTVRRRLLSVLAAVAVVSVTAGFGGSRDTGGQPGLFSDQSICAVLFGFAAEPVPVVKSSDGETVLASVEWAYSSDHNLCFLILDDIAVNTLRANPPAGAAQPPTDADRAAAARCHSAYNPERGFAAEPVPVVKTADGQVVLASVKWGYSAEHDLCYLILDGAAQQALLSHHPCQTNPSDGGGINTCNLPPALAAVYDAVVAIEAVMAYYEHERELGLLLLGELVAAVTGSSELQPIGFGNHRCTVLIRLRTSTGLDNICLSTSVDALVADAIAALDAGYREFNDVFGAECGRHAIHHDSEAFRLCIDRKTAGNPDQLPNVRFYSRQQPLTGPSLEVLLLEAIEASSSPAISTVVNKVSDCNSRITYRSGQNRYNWFNAGVGIFISKHEIGQKLERAVFDALEMARSLGVDALHAAWASAFIDPQNGLNRIQLRLWDSEGPKKAKVTALEILAAEGIAMPSYRGSQYSSELTAGDRQTLDALYRATGGAEWTSQTNWTSSNWPKGLTESICGPNAWYGVQVDDAGRVVHIDLANNNLTGTIPKELGNLARLTTLNLSNNNLTGILPRELGNLTQLTSLSLTGAIPEEIGDFTGLTGLFLRGNNLTGAIPISFSALTKLVNFYASGNLLCLPEELRAWHEAIENKDHLPDC